jgi:hypothetical protein
VTTEFNVRIKNKVLYGSPWEGCTSKAPFRCTAVPAYCVTWICLAQLLGVIWAVITPSAFFPIVNQGKTHFSINGIAVA